ncbi:hypothetical protein L1049_023947 [Liquidambar formosana]|uniref:Uncharacterized protein n=1 Tax=Liquidambar formosana TaxID=63359 RepID=A0AAP0X4D0_LIQFO
MGTNLPDSILFDTEWGTLTQFVDLPLIDQPFYGDAIYSFKDELKMLGVIIDFNEGAHFVAGGLKLPPEEPALIKADSALSLLQCVTSLRNSNKPSNQSLLEPLLKKLRGSKWLKTHMGYRSPEESVLYDAEWECHLNQLDAPFIDQEYHGTFSSVEKDVLKAIGVKTDIEEVCTLISQILTSHTQTCSIMRIYRFLEKFKWTPKFPGNYIYNVWIPDQHDTGGGKWVYWWNCILHDRSNLFGSHLHALDKYYEKELLPFLSMAFQVAEVLSFNKYLDLWNDWARGKQQGSPAELTSFWGYISEN